MMEIVSVCAEDTLVILNNFKAIVHVLLDILLQLQDLFLLNLDWLVLWPIQLMHQLLLCDPVFSIYLPQVRYAKVDVQVEQLTDACCPVSYCHPNLLSQDFTISGIINDVLWYLLLWPAWSLPKLWISYPIL